MTAPASKHVCMRTFTTAAARVAFVPQPFVAQPDPASCSRILGATVIVGAMPKKKESVLARSERLQQEALRLRRKGQYDAIVYGLKQHPEFVGKIYDQLESMFGGMGFSLVLPDGQVPGSTEDVEKDSKKWGDHT